MHYNKQLFILVDELILVDQTKRLSADEILEKDIMKEKEYLGPYYDYTCITGNEIPKTLTFRFVRLSSLDTV